jgi:predicted AlkP superfamily phosphohydrolase/phosphomutase
MGLFSRLKKGKKVVCIGLDGTPHSLVTKFMDDGLMPNFRMLTREGSFQPLMSVLPTVSCVAWSCFMTGKNPGKHNIFGFLDRMAGSYNPYVPNASNMRSDTLWDVLGREGKRVVVMGVPVTYPPKPVNGILVSGFLAPDIEKATYPADLGKELKEKQNYLLDIDPWKAREDVDSVAPQCVEVFRRRRDTLREFMKTREWDFFMTHFMETDRLHHFLWEHQEEGWEPYAEQFRDFYREVDDFLGELVDDIDGKASLVILSDHGFCTLKEEVHINHWLTEKGYLRFQADDPKGIMDIDAGNTRAYSLDPGRIYINLRGREPGGTVNPGTEYQSLREEIARDIAGIQDPETGEKMLDGVRMREDLFSGPNFDAAPDIVLVPKRGYDLKGSVNKSTLTDKGPIVGMHTLDDAMLYIRDQEIRRSDISIIDLMPTILGLMGCPIPTDLDGRDVLTN